MPSIPTGPAITWWGGVRPGQFINARFIINEDGMPDLYASMSDAAVVFLCPSLATTNYEGNRQDEHQSIFKNNQPILFALLPPLPCPTINYDQVSKLLDAEYQSFDIFIDIVDMIQVFRLKQVGNYKGSTLLSPQFTSYFGKKKPQSVETNKKALVAILVAKDPSGQATVVRGPIAKLRTGELTDLDGDFLAIAPYSGETVSVEFCALLIQEARHPGSKSAELSNFLDEADSVFLMSFQPIGQHFTDQGSTRWRRDSTGEDEHRPGYSCGGFPDGGSNDDCEIL